ncbi:STS14 protein-like [Pyrus communis]|uniref:STS14 protein-like n=1 Tax=Pyrus communis TaxID=23211 RepID=UPI0035C138A2
MAQFPLVVVVALDICSSAHGATSATAIDYVEAHNLARAPVGVGPLKWSESLATAATRVVIHQRDNNRCDLAADPESLTCSDTKYGFNQFWTTVRTRTAMTRMAVENWVE